MNCKDISGLIDPYIDGALESGPAGDLEAHLHECADCTRLVAAQRNWHDATKERATHYAAPDRLRARLGVALTEADAASAAASPASRWRPLALAASLALAVVTSVGLTTYVTVPDGQDRLLQEIVSGHVRSLMADHLTDVASSDQHTVKPWFNGRIDLAPPVDDLAADGYALIGGRLDYLDQHPVAALVYRHGQHPINLFVLPAETVRDGGAASFVQRGYNVLRWTRGGMAFWAVSDLNLSEMREFERLFESHMAAGP